MPDYREISDPDIPKKYLGPTGKVFLHSRGGDQTWSTHLNIVTGDVEEGKFHVIPMLVPGQKDIGKLLRGEKASPEQFGIAIDYAKAHPDASPLPAFGTVDEALKGEEDWHKSLEGGLLPLLQKYLNEAPGASFMPKTALTGRG